MGGTNLAGASRMPEAMEGVAAASARRSQVSRHGAEVRPAHLLRSRPRRARRGLPEFPSHLSAGRPWHPARSSVCRAASAMDLVVRVHFTDCLNSAQRATARGSRRGHPPRTDPDSAAARLRGRRGRARPCARVLPEPRARVRMLAPRAPRAGGGMRTHARGGGRRGAVVRR